MSDDLDREDEPQDDPNIRQLREQAKRSRELEKELEGMRRENAFAKAGLDLADSRTSYFVRGYDGELDPSVIKAEAEKHGFLNPVPQAPPPVPEPVPIQEQQAINRMSSATEGASAPPPPDILQEWTELAQRGKRENWSPEAFTMELTKSAAAHGLPVEMDGHEFRPGIF